MKENYEELMLSLTLEAQKKENEKKAIRITQIHEEQDKSEDVYCDGATFIQERAIFSTIVLTTFVPNGKSLQFMNNGKLYVDKVGKEYIVRIPSGTDRWIIFRDGKPYLEITMKEQNNYVFEISSTNLSKINVNDIVYDAISDTLGKNRDKDFNMKFSLNYKNALEFMKDSLSPGNGKRNNIVESFNNPSTKFEDYTVKIANELNIRLHKCRINGKSGMIGRTNGIDIKAMPDRQEICLYKSNSKLCEIYPCSNERRVCVSDKPTNLSLDFTPHYRKGEDEPYYYSMNPNDDELISYLKSICCTKYK